jgi:hypothetical protein
MTTAGLERENLNQKTAIRESLARSEIAPRLVQHKIEASVVVYYVSYPLNLQTAADPRTTTRPAIELHNDVEYIILDGPRAVTRVDGSGGIDVLE